MERAENRRRYFRIDDVVDLDYKIIDEKDVAESRSHITENMLSDCSLPTALEIISQESARQLYRIEKNQPDLAHYLKLLDKKIDLLAQAMVQQDCRTDKKNTCEINLSASGLAFNNNEFLEVGVFLELRMLLISLSVHLVTCCRVIHCKKIQSDGSESTYLISVDFVNMAEPDRELLIKHMVKRQMQQLREKRRKL